MLEVIRRMAFCGKKSRCFQWSRTFHRFPSYLLSVPHTQINKNNAIKKILQKR